MKTQLQTHFQSRDTFPANCQMLLIVWSEVTSHRFPTNTSWQIKTRSQNLISEACVAVLSSKLWQKWTEKSHRRSTRQRKAASRLFLLWLPSNLIQCDYYSFTKLETYELELRWDLIRFWFLIVWIMIYDKGVYLQLFLRLQGFICSSKLFIVYESHSSCFYNIVHCRSALDFVHITLFWTGNKFSESTLVFEWNISIEVSICL